MTIVKEYSDYAVDRLLDLYANHSHQIGSQCSSANQKEYKGFDKTDCITYVRDVVLRAFRDAGQGAAAEAVDKEIARTNALGTRSSIQALAKASGSRGGTSSPVSATPSLTPPTAVDTVGLPAIIASITVYGKPSEILVRTTTVAAL